MTRPDKDLSGRKWLPYPLSVLLRVVAFLVVFLLLVALGLLAFHRSRSERIESLMMGLMLDKGRSDEERLSRIDEAIELMGDKIVDYRPWMLKGEIHVHRSELNAAEECFIKSLKALESPMLRRSPTAGNSTVLAGDKRILEAKLSLIRQGVCWKDSGEFLAIVKERSENESQ